MAQTAIVIPARYASSRFPGKPLAEILGQSLISRTWRSAKAVAGIDEVYVATDDQRIYDHVTAFGGQAVMTDPACRNGTERVYAALADLKEQPDVVVNLQGDAVLTPPWVIQPLVDVMLNDPSVVIATPAVQLNKQQYDALKASKQEGASSGTLVTFDKQFNALYFSKALIPYMRDENAPGLPAYRHIGMYAYRYNTLKKYLALEPGQFEQAEQLEQLRALEHGLPIRVVVVDYKGRTHWSVDNPEDIAHVEKLIKQEGELV
ncbi:3-deoxy-manno-octulosonate cytidylyltransferase [Oligoflexia bacterium]|nr:3-deoxy-manno-octulosonate cytidylyltransferase [Oligoflexia bacterium]